MGDPWEGSQGKLSLYHDGSLNAKVKDLDVILYKLMVNHWRILSRRETGSDLHFRKYIWIQCVNCRELREVQNNGTELR